MISESELEYYRMFVFSNVEVNSLVEPEPEEESSTQKEDQSQSVACVIEAYQEWHFENLNRKNKFASNTAGKAESIQPNCDQRVIE